MQEKKGLIFCFSNKAFVDAFFCANRFIWQEGEPEKPAVAPDEEHDAKDGVGEEARKGAAELADPIVDALNESHYKKQYDALLERKREDLEKIEKANSGDLFDVINGLDLDYYKVEPFRLSQEFRQKEGIDARKLADASEAEIMKALNAKKDIFDTVINVEVAGFMAEYRGSMDPFTKFDHIVQLTQLINTRRRIAKASGEEYLVQSEFKQVIRDTVLGGEDSPKEALRGGWISAEQGNIFAVKDSYDLIKSNPDLFDAGDLEYAKTLFEKAKENKKGNLEKLFSGPTAYSIEAFNNYIYSLYADNNDFRLLGQDMFDKVAPPLLNDQVVLGMDMQDGHLYVRFARGYFPISDGAASALIDGIGMVKVKDADGKDAHLMYPSEDLKVYTIDGNVINMKGSSFKDEINEESTRYYYGDGDKEAVSLIFGFAQHEYQSYVSKPAPKSEFFK